MANRTTEKKCLEELPKYFETLDVFNATFMSKYKKSIL